MQDSITPDQVKFLATQAGLTLSDAQIGDLVSAYPTVAKMAELIHQPRGLAAEPSNIFVPGAAS